MGALSSLASVGLNLALAEQASKRQSRTINARRDQQIRAIEQRDQEQQRLASERLRRQLATQRARAGAAGVGNGASSNAVLQGLIEEALQADQARRQGVSQAVSTLNRRARNARRRNVLDLAQSTTRSGFSLLRNSGRRTSLLDRPR